MAEFYHKEGCFVYFSLFSGYFFCLIFRVIWCMQQKQSRSGSGRRKVEVEQDDTPSTFYGQNFLVTVEAHRKPVGQTD